MHAPATTEMRAATVSYWMQHHPSRHRVCNRNQSRNFECARVNAACPATATESGHYLRLDSTIPVFVPTLTGLVGYVAVRSQSDFVCRIVIPHINVAFDWHKFGVSTLMSNG